MLRYWFDWKAASVVYAPGASGALETPGILYIGFWPGWAQSTPRLPSQCVYTKMDSPVATPLTVTGVLLHQL